MKHQIKVEYETAALNELPKSVQALHLAAQRASGYAYAPYSGFNVGVALLLESGEVVTASNKENASFPAGVCAERNALNAASDNHHGSKVTTMVIMAQADEFSMTEPVAPCGICRQVICETEKMQQSPIKIYLVSSTGQVVILERASDLLPFHFYLPALKK